MEEKKNYDGQVIEMGKKDHEYWCEQFNCERRDLMEAVFKVGNNANAVLAYLEMNGKIKDN